MKLSNRAKAKEFRLISSVLDIHLSHILNVGIFNNLDECLLRIIPTGGSQYNQASETSRGFMYILMKGAALELESIFSLARSRNLERCSLYFLSLLY